MQPLITQIDNINAQIKIGIDYDFKAHGLCRPAIRNGEKQQFDAKTDEAVVFDDTYGSSFYHKINGAINYDLVKAPGKTKLYNAVAPVSLYCFSKHKNFDDHILKSLSNVKLLQIQNVDWDSYKIIASETGRPDFDFNKYLFVVNYQITFKTDNCNDQCL